MLMNYYTEQKKFGKYCYLHAMALYFEPHVNITMALFLISISFQYQS